MVTFITHDGLAIDKPTHLRIVLELSRVNWQRGQPTHGYMEDVIDRVQRATNTTFTGKLSAYRFLRFLQACGLGELRVSY